MKRQYKHFNEINEISNHIKAAKAGSKSDIEWLFNHYDKEKIPSIIDYFMNLPNPGILDEDDIRQDCYIGILQCLNSPCQFSINVYTYMCNVVRRDYRNHHTFVRIPSYIYDNYEDLLNDLYEQLEVISLDEYEEINEEITDESVLIYHNPLQPHYEDIIEKCKEVLTEKQFTILYLYYVYDYTLDQIGKMYKVTRERIRQIIEKSIEICQTELGHLV